MNRKIVFLLLLFLGLNTMAQEVRFSMSAPDMVSAGEQFSLTLSLNAEGQDLRMPDLPNFDILMGPSVSQSRSYSVVNGKMSQSVNFTYTYVLRAQSEGTFTIPSATIKSKRETYQSNSVTIKVIKGRQQTTAQSQSGGGTSQGNSGQAKTGNVSRDNLFIQYEVDKRNVYKGEMILVALKLYSRVSLSVADQTLPSFEGFWTEEIEIPSAEQTQAREAVDGIIYNVYTLQKKILVPQQTGTLYIEPAEMVFNVQQRVAPQSMFDDFFGSYQNVRVPVKTQRISINVKDLPAAPAGFKGAVGKFSLSSTIDKTDIKSNEAITIKTKISGSGNLKQITPPEFKLPADFEVYDPKTSYDYKASQAGITGSTSFEQVVIPRYAGKFNIPSENFVYFDPSSGSYKTLSTTEFNINVEKGSDEQSATVVSSISKQDVKYIGKDIRYIKPETKLKSKNSILFGTANFFLLYIAIALVFAFFVFFQRKRIKENANVALMRNRQANKLARKHLNAASVCLKNNNKEEFFEALSKALWGYLSDKLTLPLSELNRDNAQSTLLKYQVEEATINEFIRIIDVCEMARFAPTAVNESIADLYSDGETLISNFEKQIRKRS